MSLQSDAPFGFAQLRMLDGAGSFALDYAVMQTNTVQLRFDINVAMPSSLCRLILINPTASAMGISAALVLGPGG